MSLHFLSGSISLHVCVNLFDFLTMFFILFFDFVVRREGEICVEESTPPKVKKKLHPRTVDYAGSLWLSFFLD